ncbi:hypothetical protein ALC57_08736 [Trachymyrmex cornetzi]|uniref:CCHC-type domain-containing protein n=1 Tax=Trachymyrmex cornetzi TaxID=471704 RepID=A0A195E178_9HYME|nr:hypothetical protein ALC57_08736 [Trachymyrmex cornetzi]
MTRTGAGTRIGGIRQPRASAVVIICNEGCTYAEAMTLAREGISLEELDIIDNMRMRRAVSGGLVLEIYGEDQEIKADRLADRLVDLFQNRDVIIRRPTKRTEFLISGLDDLVTREDVAEFINKLDRNKYDGIKIGNIKMTRSGMGTIWIQCPTIMAANIPGRRVRIGWSWAKIDILKKRPLRCYKCLARGHVRQKYPSEVDRSGACFNCGGTDYTIQVCRNRPCCPVCKERGSPYNHRAGSENCRPVPPILMRIEENTNAGRRTAGEVRAQNNETLRIRGRNGEAGNMASKY